MEKTIKDIMAELVDDLVVANGHKTATLWAVTHATMRLEEREKRLFDNAL